MEEASENKWLVSALILTNKASLSITVLIFVQSSSQQMFSSAVATKAEQQAKTL